MRKILESIVVGIIFGLVSHLVGKFLPDEWQFLIETKVIWLIPAFLTAFNMPLRRRATDSVLVSTLTLLTTGAIYYLTEVIKNNRGWYFPDEFGMFIIPAIFAGVITGYVAYLGHSATKDFIRYASTSVLPALYTGQGIDGILETINNFEWTPELITKLAGGFVFYLLISGNSRFKPKSFLTYLILVAVITGGFSFVPNMV